MRAAPCVIDGIRHVSSPASSLARRASRRASSSRIAASEQRDALGGQDFIYSQRSGVSESLFKGDLLGVDADVATGDLRSRRESRDLAHITGAYHVPERFLHRFAAHVAQNMLVEDDDEGDADPEHEPRRRKASGLRAAGVPLILGIWGGKGGGKSFNVELCCRDMRITPFVVSAGELEDPVAGEPGALLRRRYLAAAKEASTRGTPAVLIINDLDAGVGRFKDDKVTVNNQIVQASLMSLCDDPTRVHFSGKPRSRAWDSREERDGEERLRKTGEAAGIGPVARCRRVPVIVTGNDFSRLYAPLTRAGRMDLWHWEPSRVEIAAMVHETFRDAEARGGFGYEGRGDAEALVNAFPDQPLDFFAAARSRCVDDAVRAWLVALGSAERMRIALVGNHAEAEATEADPDAIRSRSAASWRRSRRRPLVHDVSLPALLRAAELVAAEQQNVLDVRLAREYVNAWTAAKSAGAIREERRRRAASARVREEAGTRGSVFELEVELEAKRAARRADAEAEARLLTAAVAEEASATMRRASAEASARGETVKFEIGVAGTSASARVAEEEALARISLAESRLPWTVLDCVECRRERRDHPASTVFVDVRPRRTFERETIEGALNFPAAVSSGTIADPIVAPDAAGATAALRAFLAEAKSKSKSDAPLPTRLVVIGDGGGEGSYTRDALTRFHEYLASDAHLSRTVTLVEMRDGVGGWLRRYTPTGKPRPRYVGYGKDNEETMFTASN
jgi:rhodanese-related sulfurtransferase